MLKPCTAIELKYLSERYEYRVLAASVMDHILIDADLSDGARTLWLILYRSSALTKTFSIVASAGFLKIKTGRSEATLWRQIRELKTKGYLSVVKQTGPEGEALPNIYGPRLPKYVVKKIKETATPREVVSTTLLNDELQGVRDDLISKSSCEVAGYEFEQEKPLDKYRVGSIDELPSDVADRLKEFGNKPFINIPTTDKEITSEELQRGNDTKLNVDLPCDGLTDSDIKSTPDYGFSNDSFWSECFGTSPDYDFTYKSPNDIGHYCNDDVKPEIEQHPERAVSTQESVYEAESENTRTHFFESNTETLKSKQELILEGSENDGEASFEIETGASVRFETEETNHTPTEYLTTTGIITKHSRDSWKCFPHVRLQILTKLGEFGFEEKRCKELMKQIDWTLTHGAMSDWHTRKGINTCLKLIREGRWERPHF